MRMFKDLVFYCNLLDMGLIGPLFTWTNVKQGEDAVRQCLDWAFCNAEWWNIFPICAIIHEGLTASDHCPLLLLKENQNSYESKPFNFEAGWMDFDGYDTVINTEWEK
ncbi:hypothetical protein LINPERHAP1_LOCUS26815 [Linum perenne]